MNDRYADHDEAAAFARLKDTIDGFVESERALADDLYEGLDWLLQHGDPRKADAAKARYKEARGR